MEGMVAKRPYCVYEANLRTTNCIKVKRKDTIDAVIVGYTDSPRSYLVALWDSDIEEFVPFVWITPQKDILAGLIDGMDRQSLPPLLAGNRSTDVRVQPSLVVEIGGDHIFPSIGFACGRRQKGQGWPLLSPTLIRERRDKTSSDITTVEEFLELPVMAGYPKPTRSTE
jgi:ATP-dependent DNA ligase